jgi:hypothetical protein
MVLMQEIKMSMYALESLESCEAFNNEVLCLTEVFWKQYENTSYSELKKTLPFYTPDTPVAYAMKRVLAKKRAHEQTQADEAWLAENARANAKAKALREAMEAQDANAPRYVRTEYNYPGIRVNGVDLKPVTVSVHRLV